MRIAIATLGCKINQYDSAVIQQRLEAEHRFVPFDDEADCYIINACTVTDRADWEARQLVRRARRRNPAARVLVTGCYAQVRPEEVAAIPGVDAVVGLNRLEDLARLVGEGGRRIAWSDARSEREVRVLGARRLPGRARAFLKVQEGCNFACTYCIIPKARGRSRSVPPDEVVRQARLLAAEGAAEIVLTGIHLGGYGRDLRPRSDLASLVERLVAEGIVPRLRLSSLDPREVTGRLIELMARSSAVCDHLHICVQAGDDELLRRMRRNYDTAYFADLLHRVRAALPDAALGTDLIVGFPGESDEAFRRSLEFLERLPLTYLHVFPYSVRRGTPAASFPDQVPQAVKKERARIARELGAKKKSEFHRRFLGRTLSVLLEAPGANGVWKGHTRNYLPVLVKDPQAEARSEVAVRLERLERDWLWGAVSGRRVGAEASHGCEAAC